MNKLLRIMAALLLLTSCEGVTKSEGIVIDQLNRQPLDSVTVKSYVGKVNKRTFEREMITDTTGGYFASTGLTGCMGGCPDLKVEFSRQGYKTKVETNPSDTVFLEKN